MASNEPVNMLTLDVVRRILSKTNKDAPSGVLDLSRANNFQLRSHNEGGTVKTALAGLIHVRQCENEREYFTRKVRKVILSGNDLSARADIGGSLYELRVFRRSLEQVIAANCQLDSLGWGADKEYPMLVELNLQHNYLTSIPDLSCCPRLKRLLLANNEISGFSNLKKCPVTLEFLDVAENHIRYSSLIDMRKDLQGFSKLGNLAELRVEGNEFTLDFKDKYRQLLLKTISEGGSVRLKVLDGQSTDGIVALATNFVVEEFAEEEKSEEAPVVSSQKSNVVAERQRAWDASFANKSRFYVLDHLLEQCLSSSSTGTMKVMELLQNEANRLVKVQPSGIRSEADVLFTSEDSNVQLKMYEFLQKCVALSERKKEMLEPLLHVLATLSRCAGSEEDTHEKRFGALCLRQLQDFMSANEETRSLVIKVVNAELYSTPLSNLETVRSTFVPDLCKMAEDSQCPELLVGAIKYLMNRLLQVVHSPGERALIFKTFAVASRDDREDGARFELGAEGVGEQLLQELIENNPNYEMRIWVLQTLCNLCQPNVRHGKKADSREFADYLASVKGFHRTLLLDLSSASRTTGLGSEDKPEEMIAMEIECLCAMLKSSRQAFADLCGAKDPQLFHMLAKYFLPKVPYLLAETATYRTVRCLLQTTFCPISVREDDSSAPPRNKRDVLEDLQKITLTNNVGNLLEYLREDSVLYADAWKVATRKLEGAPSFKDLKHPKLHALFVSIIDLIAAFNNESSSNSEDGSWKIAAAITESMNTKGRESRLFACLEVPSDVVKLAAVQCLDTVKLSEFEDHEIQHLVRMLQDVMNVSAGKTEEVIAISLNILTKLCMEDKRNIFQRSFGRAAVDASLRILEMNVSRDTRSMVSETEEKGVLTLACVRFLQAASALDTTAKYLSSEPIAAKADRILAVEDGFAGKVRFLASKAVSTSYGAGSSFVSIPEHDPVLIEVTSAGAHVEHLTKVLIDVAPTGPVAPRLLRRIGNLLMGNQECIDLVRRVPTVSKEILGEIRASVRAEALNERELSEFWYLPRFGIFNERVQRDREKQHEQFTTSLCLENMLERLDRALQDVQAEVHPVLLPGRTANAVSKDSDLHRNSLGKRMPGNTTLPQLLERHLMSEKERQERATEQELGGGLRIVPIELTRAEELEAQREFTAATDEDAEFGTSDTTHAAIRVFYAALRYGTVETMANAQQTLRSLQRFRSLVAHFFGSRERPVFARSNLGTKFFLVAEAILEMPPLRRFESETELRPLHALVFSCADRALGLLHKRLLVHSRLAPGDHSLIAAVMSCCATAALQMEYVMDDTGNERPPEELFRDLVPSSLLASAVRLLLYDMTLVKVRRVGYRNLFGEIPEDDARESTIQFLAFCLRHSSAYRYSILEYLIRSNITDQYPVRRMLIQELMKRTHKLGSTQRAALEFRVKEEEEIEHGIVDNEMNGKGHTLYSTVSVVTAKNKFIKTSQPPKPAEPPSAPTWNVFAWCTGADRVSKPNVTPTLPIDTPAEKIDGPAEPEASRVQVAPRRQQLDLLWDAVDVPLAPNHSDRKHMSPWQADRVGSRERVVAFSFVRWFEAGARQKNEDSFNHVLVLTTEKYILFRISSAQDAEHPRRWSVVWRRPYRAVCRIVVAAARLHLLHRASDSQSEAQAITATALTPSRSSARELALAFFRLNRAWRGVEKSLNPSLQQKALRTVENGSSEAFRRLNFGASTETRRSNDRAQRSRDVAGGFFCEPVHLCKKQGSWEPVLAILQHDVLCFAKKNWSQVVFDTSSDIAGADQTNPSSGSAGLTIVLKYELHALIKIKFDIRVEDFDRTDVDLGCPSLVAPFPALVLKMGEEELAVAFVDDLSRTMWRRLLS